MVQFFMEIEHSLWCDTKYIIDRNESLCEIITILNKDDNLSNKSLVKEKTKENKDLNKKIINYFN